MPHLPVLQNEVLKYLSPKPNENFIDATVGLAGHTRAILEKTKPKGKVLGIEIDSELFDKLKAEKIAQLILVHDSYVNLIEIVRRHNFQPVNGILFDLGLSSWHLEESGRGFSFQRNERLDMRYRVTHFRRSSEKCYQLTAMTIVNTWSQKEIEKILKEYGEERFAERIAREIIVARQEEPIKSTAQLVEIIKKATPTWYQRRKTHFATKTFQALRIAVNDELENLKKALPQAEQVLQRGGRIVLISFHSLEDRIIKNFFKEEQKKGHLKILTKKPTLPTLDELQKNPRARSAKLRAAEKIIEG